jgi:hypothetical protein
MKETPLSSKSTSKHATPQTVRRTLSQKRKRMKSKKEELNQKNKDMKALLIMRYANHTAKW